MLGGKVWDYPRRILASILQYDGSTAGMAVEDAGRIVDLALYDDPATLASRVFLHLGVWDTFRSISGSW